MAVGSRRYLQRIKEETAGTTPATPTFERLNIVTDGDAIMNNRSATTSNIIRSDRAIVDSRLGQNQPDLTIPFELTYDSVDDFLAGALGDDWIGDYVLTETVSFGDATNTITLDDSSDWEDKGMAVGDFITIEDAVTAGNNGVFKVATVVDAVITVVYPDDSAVAFTVGAADEVSITGGFYGGSIDSSSNNLTFSATNKTITAASAVWLDTDIQIGDNIYISETTSNDGWYKITAVTSTVLTTSSTVANGSETAATVYYGTSTSIVRCGLSVPSFTIEEGFEDVPTYHNVKGAKVSNMSISIQTDSRITGSFDFQGTKYSGFDSTSIETAHTEADINPVFDSYTGYIDFASSIPDCTITGIDFTLDNSLNRRFALYNKDACSIGDGRTNVTGTVSGFFNDATLSDLYNDESNIDTKIRMVDLDGNAYVFGFPKMRFNTNSISISENDVTESLGFQALGGDDDSTLYIRKQQA